ncbi:MAG TPA: Hsp20/alpha crystallin family protein [Fimbriimonadaceae bacterium]|nr:Hsp20/alpha crystallin family protein [Fimbriimonadaceae bacterium]
MMARREVEEWFWQVGSDLQRLSEELHRFRPAIASGNAWEPRVDVLEDERRIIIKAEIAGVRGEDIQLLYVPERHSVLIRGLRREEEFEDTERTNFYQLEIFYGPFQREVKLPDVSVRSDEIRASYRNGFLLVQIPKQERIVVKTVTIKKI